MKKNAVLLINLGTPDELSPRAVRRYLREFLNDPRVIDLPFPLRWPLVNLFIIPFRYKRTTALYSKIWGASGSPLLTNTNALTKQLARHLGDDYQVEFAMRYGNPSIKKALAKLNNPNSLTVIPLFPQYSSAANGSAIEKLLLELKTQWNMPTVRIIHQFYNQSDYIQAYAEVIKQQLPNKPVDMLLFSYHGLPERHIDKSQCQAECNRIDPCPLIEHTNLYCYRAQCYATSALIAKALNLKPHQYQVSFQSRLGRTPWVAPYTDLLLHKLIEEGHSHLAVVCPSFLVDCLETLEEVNIRMRAQWHQIGGGEFTFIPCLNQSPRLVASLAAFIEKSST